MLSMRRRCRTARRVVEATGARQQAAGHGHERLLEVERDGGPVVAVDHELARGGFDAAAGGHGRG